MFLTYDLEILSTTLVFENDFFLLCIFEKTIFFLLCIFRLLLCLSIKNVLKLRIPIRWSILLPIWWSKRWTPQTIVEYTNTHWKWLFCRLCNHSFFIACQEMVVHRRIENFISIFKVLALITHLMNLSSSVQMRKYPSNAKRGAIFITFSRPNSIFPFFYLV